MKNSYESIEEAYNQVKDELTKYARKHVFNKEDAIDCVHEAFVKAIEYEKKKGHKYVSKFILYKECARACRRINKFSKEVPFDFSDAQGTEGFNQRKKLDHSPDNGAFDKSPD